MEQDKLPCGAVLSPDGACDREVFERVWRRVMPEDRPDCPFTPVSYTHLTLPTN